MATKLAPKRTATKLAPKLVTSRARQKALSQLSPFELKDFLITLAKDASRTSARSMLNAGRGNPNWIATEPREAFFLMGQFALGECRRKRDDGIMAGMPQKSGIADRFRQFLDANGSARGAKFLRGVYDYGVGTGKFIPDEWIHELTDSIIGDNYPVPDRMLVHCERIVHDYLIKEMCAGKPPKGKFDIFAVEGGTAAMCYLFDSLMQNGFLKRGDTVALFVPTFTPYIEICHLDRFSFKVVTIDASDVRSDGSHSWHVPASEIAKLENPKVKMAAIVNPSNPPSVALGPKQLKQIVGIVKRKNPNLMLVTDDVYGTFVTGFRSLMAELPYNTLCVYSFSKNFGCTGWRLGVIALHEKNLYDDRLAKLPSAQKKALNKRYGALTLEPEKIKFIDRLVADSRYVALNHTAGLSLPQQVMMSLFSLAEMMDTDKRYQAACKEIVHRRIHALIDGMGLQLGPNPSYDAYYGLVDFEFWARKNIGQDAVEYLKRNVHPLDLAFRLAESHGIVLLNGGGFAAPDWSLRVSLANLPDEVYEEIGRGVRAIARGYRDAFEASKRAEEVGERLLATALTGGR